MVLLGPGAMPGIKLGLVTSRAAPYPLYYLSGLTMNFHISSSTYFLLYCSQPLLLSSPNKGQKQASEKETVWGWGCSSVVEHKVYMCKALGLISGTDPPPPHTHTIIHLNTSPAKKKSLTQDFMANMWQSESLIARL